MQYEPCGETPVALHVSVVAELSGRQVRVGVIAVDHKVGTTTGLNDALKSRP